MIRKQPLANGHVAVTFQMPASVWADSLFLVGDFNQWDKHSHPMRQRADGVWEITLELDAGREYQRTLAQRREQEAKNLSDLTGWSINVIRHKMNLASTATREKRWWEW